MKTAIIIATYNEKENIGLLIRDILSLPLTEVEIIVVDDNSPDQTGEIVEDLALKNSNLRLLSLRKKWVSRGRVFWAWKKRSKEEPI